MSVIICKKGNGTLKTCVCSLGTEICVCNLIETHCQFKCELVLSYVPVQGTVKNRALPSLPGGSLQMFRVSLNLQVPDISAVKLAVQTLARKTQ